MTEEQRARRREYDRQWRLNHPEQVRAIRDRYRSKETTRERERAYSKAYYEKHAGKNKPKKVRWISVEEHLPPEVPGNYLVRVRSGGPPYGDWEYNYDIAWWGEYWDLDGKHGFDWVSIICDWDGDVQITHWMRIPDLPEEETET